MLQFNPSQAVSSDKEMQIRHGQLFCQQNTVLRCNAFLHCKAVLLHSATSTAQPQNTIWLFADRRTTFYFSAEWFCI